MTHDTCIMENLSWAQSGRTSVILAGLTHASVVFDKRLSVRCWPAAEGQRGDWAACLPWSSGLAWACSHGDGGEVPRWAREGKSQCSSTFQVSTLSHSLLSHWLKQITWPSPDQSECGKELSKSLCWGRWWIQKVWTYWGYYYDNLRDLC